MKAVVGVSWRVAPSFFGRPDEKTCEHFVLGNFPVLLFDHFSTMFTRTSAKESIARYYHVEDGRASLRK